MDVFCANGKKHVFFCQNLCFFAKIYFKNVFSIQWADLKQKTIFPFTDFFLCTWQINSNICLFPRCSPIVFPRYFNPRCQVSPAQSCQYIMCPLFFLYVVHHVSCFIDCSMVFMFFMVFSVFSIVVTRVSSFSLMFIYVCLSFIIFIGFSIAVECCICVPSFSIHCSMVLACFLFIFVPSFCIHFSMAMVLKSFSSFCSRSSMVLICFPIFFIDFQWFSKLMQEKRPSPVSKIVDLLTAPPL